MPHSPPASGSGYVGFAQFCALVEALSEWARHERLVVPYFRSPPQRLGVHRTIRRAESCRPMVFVALRGRPGRAVIADLVDGLFLANDVDVGAPDLRRDAAVDHLIQQGQVAARPAA